MVLGLGISAENICRETVVMLINVGDVSYPHSSLFLPTSVAVFGLMGYFIHVHDYEVANFQRLSIAADIFASFSYRSQVRDDNQGFLHAVSVSTFLSTQLLEYIFVNVEEAEVGVYLPGL